MDKLLTELSRTADTKRRERAIAEDPFRRRDEEKKRIKDLHEQHLRDEVIRPYIRQMQEAGDEREGKMARAIDELLKSGLEYTKKACAEAVEGEIKRLEAVITQCVEKGQGIIAGAVEKGTKDIKDALDIENVCGRIETSIKELTTSSDTINEGQKLAVAAVKAAVDLGINSIKEALNGANESPKLAAAAIKTAVDAGIEDIKEALNSADETPKLAAAAIKEAVDLSIVDIKKALDIKGIENVCVSAENITTEIKRLESVATQCVKKGQEQVIGTIKTSVETAIQDMKHALNTKDLEDVCSKVEASVKKMNTAVTGTTKKMEVSASNISKATEACGTAVEKIGTVATDITDIATKIQKSTTNVTKYVEGIATTSKDIRKASKRIKQSTGNFAKSTEAYGKSAGEIEAASTRIEESTAQFSKSKEDREAAHKAVVDALSEIVEEGINSLVDAVEQAKAVGSELAESYETEAYKLTEIQGELGALNAELGDKIGELNVQLEDGTDVLKKLNRKAKKTQARIIESGKSTVEEAFQAGVDKLKAEGFVRLAPVVGKFTKHLETTTGELTRTAAVARRVSEDISTSYEVFEASFNGLMNGGDDLVEEADQQLPSHESLSPFIRERGFHEPEHRSTSPSILQRESHEHRSTPPLIHQQEFLEYDQTPVQLSRRPTMLLTRRQRESQTHEDERPTKKRRPIPQTVEQGLDFQYNELLSDLQDNQQEAEEDHATVADLAMRSSVQPVSVKVFDAQDESILTEEWMKDQGWPKPLMKAFLGKDKLGFHRKTNAKKNAKGPKICWALEIRWTGKPLPEKLEWIAEEWTDHLHACPHCVAKRDEVKKEVDSLCFYFRPVNKDPDKLELVVLDWPEE